MKATLLLALAVALALPGMASADKCYSGHYGGDRHYAYDYDTDHRTAVAGYSAMNNSSSNLPSTHQIDQARIAEYKSIFGSRGMVAGYSGTSWRPWMGGGAWATVNGERMWVTRDNFVWVNNRWVWADDNAADFYFEDNRFDINSADWGVSIDNDRFDLDVDRDKMDVDPDRFNIDEDRLKIETDID
jgi:hypothetical protein